MSSSLRTATRGLQVAQSAHRAVGLSTRWNSNLPKYNEAPSFRATQPPNPLWQLGQGLADNGALANSGWKEDVQKGWSTWDSEQSPVDLQLYQLLTSAIVPRPIAFVSTLSKDGIPNLAPFSYFSLVSHNPPLLGVSFALSPRKPKDTRENILATKEFTVNLISEPFIEAANLTSVEAPPDVDEWALSGLTQLKSKYIMPARVKESAISAECKLFFHHDISPPGSSQITGTLVLGLIKALHVRKAVMKEDGTVDTSKLRALSRLGGSTYARIGEGFDLRRPSWREMKEKA